MKKRPEWRQATAIDQLVALNARIQGDLSNYDDGIIKCDEWEFRERLNLEELAELLPFVQQKNLGSKLATSSSISGKPNSLKSWSDCTPLGRKGQHDTSRVC